MDIIFIDPYHPDNSKIKEVAQALKEGKIVALPTDTVYGLAVVCDDEQAVERLYQVRNRTKDKPFTYHFDSPSRVFDYIMTLPPFGYRLIESYWPGGLTLIYYAKDNEDKKIGVRVPNHPITQLIIKEVDKPLFIPSANLSGHPEINDPYEIARVFEDKVDLIVDCRLRMGTVPSTVLDLTFHPPHVVREGALSLHDILSVFIKKRIMFVCTGNTCRSVMAHFILENTLKNREYAYNRYEVISAGISALEGMKPSQEVIKLMQEKEGIDVSNYRSQRLTREKILSSDIIVVMENIHKRVILEKEPTASERVFMLSVFLPQGEEKDIEDPIGRPYEVYENTYYTIKRAVEELVDWL